MLLKRQGVQSESFEGAAIGLFYLRFILSYFRRSLLDAWEPTYQALGDQGAIATTDHSNRVLKT